MLALNLTVDPPSRQDRSCPPQGILLKTDDVEPTILMIAQIATIRCNNPNNPSNILCILIILKKTGHAQSQTTNRSEVI
jgi:hypothetical protein